MLAAAIAAEAGVIVTFNLRDFPTVVLAEHGIQALHPDEFVLRQLDATADAVLAIAREHRLSLTRPPKSVAEYLTTLETAGLTRSASALRDRVEHLD